MRPRAIGPDVLAVSLDWPQEVHRFPSDLAEIVERHATGS